jgi:hypothetical protein
MTDKDHDKNKAAADKAAADKAAADKREADKREADTREAGHVDNRDQDPNHPANITQPRDMRPAAERDRIEGPVYAPENLMTEQEKDAARNAPGSSAKQPYPTGEPPPPSESVSYGQGIKGATDVPSAKPGSASGPAGQAPGVSDKPKKEKEKD